MCVSLKAPQGKIRIVGRECGRDWVIADLPDSANAGEIEGYFHDNRGAGIDVSVYDDEGKIIR